MNKITILLALLLGTAMPSLALQKIIQQKGSHAFAMSQDIRDVDDVDNQWGASENVGTVQLTISSTVLVVAPASGVVDAVCVSSGVAGDWAILVDTTPPAAGFTGIPALIGSGSNINIVGFLDSQVTQPFTSPTLGADVGCKRFDPPMPFANGLSAVNSSAAIRTVVRYRIYQQ